MKPHSYGVGQLTACQKNSETERFNSKTLCIHFGGGWKKSYLLILNNKKL